MKSSRDMIMLLGIVALVFVAFNLGPIRLRFFGSPSVATVLSPKPDSIRMPDPNTVESFNGNYRTEIKLVPGRKFYERADTTVAIFDTTGRVLSKPRSFRTLSPQARANTVILLTETKSHQ